MPVMRICSASEASLASCWSPCWESASRKAYWSWSAAICCSSSARSRSRSARWSLGCLRCCSSEAPSSSSSWKALEVVSDTRMRGYVFVPGNAQCFASSFASVAKHRPLSWEHNLFRTIFPLFCDQQITWPLRCFLSSKRASSKARMSHTYVQSTRQGKRKPQISAEEIVTWHLYFCSKAGKMRPANQ